MHHLYYTPEYRDSYSICLLVPVISREDMKKAYIDPYGIDKNDVMVLTLHTSPGKKKTSSKEMKQYVEEQLLSALTECECKYLVVADGEYFKLLTGAIKAEALLGYVLDCKFGPWKVVYVPNYRNIFYDPEKVTAKIAQGINALKAHQAGIYRVPGNDLLRFEQYPKTLKEIEDALNWLLAKDEPLSVDIETFDLKAHRAGIGTIAFAWNQHEGLAFPVDYQPIEGTTSAPFGIQFRNDPVRKLLKSFFEQFIGKTLYHHIAFDVTVLIYQLYMADILDTEGLLHGMDTLLRYWDCTKLIAYLATNSCAGNKLSLKDQAQEFAGNYGLGGEIRDITKIRLDTLLKYNLVDACSTWFVNEKHWDTMVEDQQFDIYENLFKPATVDIIQMQLTGLPVDMNQVKKVRGILEAERQEALDTIMGSRIVERYTHHLNEKWVIKKNETLKVKRVTIADAKEVFNPNSDDQIREILYTMLKLPVISLTKSKQASTSGDALTALKNHTKDQAILTFLDALQDLSVVSTILDTFVPALEDAIPGPDGWHYLCGNFNLGGTLSGRLSSSEPNLQNLPMGNSKGKKGKFGKLIKSCIAAPEGFVLLGLDFASLEDRISALQTKDPNKLKVYTDGYDGHSMRAYSYWSSKMPDIDPNSVESINSIAKKYPVERGASKAPTFALTYQGTYITLMKNCGFSEAEAKRIEASFKKLYKVSIDWVNQKLNQAGRNGYVTAAFGLRVRTPLLAQVIRGNSKTPFEAEAEGRSAGNALGQSWCLLNSRAWVEFMGKVRKSPYRLDIRPSAQIHDAGYAIVPDDARIIAWVNEHLVKAVEWQDHPEIYHDQVKLGGEVSLFWPNWSNEIVIPNGANENQIPEIITKALA
jgi:DNA polymerase-1